MVRPKAPFIIVTIRTKLTYQLVRCTGLEGQRNGVDRVACDGIGACPIIDQLTTRDRT